MDGERLVFRLAWMHVIGAAIKAFVNTVGGEYGNGAGGPGTGQMSCWLELTGMIGISELELVLFLILAVYVNKC